MSGRKRSRAGGRVGEKYNMTISQRASEDDLDYLRRIAKVANERLRQLNKIAKEPDYQGVLQYAYSNAMYDIASMTGSDRTRTRFPTSIPKTKSGEINQRELHRRINAIEKFIESPTSTKRGIQAIYKQRAKTTNDNLGLKGKERFTWQDLARFYENEKAVTASKSVGGSETVLRALGYLRRKVGSDPKKIKAVKAGNLKVSDDFVINRVAQELIKEGINPADIFNKK